MIRGAADVEVNRLSSRFGGLMIRGQQMLKVNRWMAADLEVDDQGGRQMLRSIDGWRQIWRSMIREGGRGVADLETGDKDAEVNSVY